MSTQNKLWTPSRRAMLQGLGASAAALAAPNVVRAQGAGTIKVGFLTPTTGPLALFGETDGFTVDKIRDALGGRITAADGRTYDLEILVRDSQSDPNRSAEVAACLHH